MTVNSQSLFHRNKFPFFLRLSVLYLELKPTSQCNFHIT